MLFLCSLSNNTSIYINQLSEYFGINYANTELNLAIFTGSVTILAIVFSISQFTITQLSNNYSPYILERYRRDRLYKWTFWIFIVLAFFSLFTAIYNNYMIFMEINLIMFIIGIFLLIFHFGFIMKLMDPKRLLQLLLADIETDIQEGKIDDVEKYTISMGDIATKSLIKKEEKITLDYINGFYDLFTSYLIILSKLKDRKSIPENLRYTDVFGFTIDKVSSNIYDHLGRVFLNALNNNEKRVTTEIASKLFQFTLITLKSEERTLFERLIDTRSFRGAIYLQLFEQSIEHRDKSMEIFLRNPFSLLQVYLSSVPNVEVDKSLTYELIDFHLLRMQKLIIEHDDYELIKKETNLISVMIKGLDPKELLDDIITHINNSLGCITSTSDPEHKEMEYLFSYIRHEILRDFNARDEFKERLSEFEKMLKSKSKTKDDVGKISEEFKKIRVILDRYEVIARLHRTFFLTGAYILFCRKNNGIEWAKYIKELWEHTTPEDADAFHLSKTPVCFDPLWLTYLMVYGGSGSKIWLDNYDLEWEGYHGILDYVYQYWILLMGKWSEELPIPDENKIKNWKNNGYDFKLDFWYNLCRDFLYHKNGIKENFQKIKQEGFYEGLYTEEHIERLEESFDSTVESMEKALKTLQDIEHSKAH